MTKTGDGNYDDGIYYYFHGMGEDVTNLHVTAKVNTNSSEVESCDIRVTTIDSNETVSTLFKKKEWTDVLFYRMGYFNY